MRLFTLLAVVCFSSGCGERLFIPEAYTPDMEDRIVSVVEDDQIKIYLEHLETTNGNFLFDLEVENKGDFIIYLRTDEIFYLPKSNGKNQANIVTAHTEESLNEDIKTDIKEKKTLSVLLQLASVALVVNDVVQDSRDFSQETWTRQDENRAIARDALTAAGLIALDLKNFTLEENIYHQREQLKYLPESYLRNGIIFPGESVRGTIYLPASDISKMRFVIPVKGEIYTFDLKQASPREMKVIDQY